MNAAIIFPSDQISYNTGSFFFFFNEFSGEIPRKPQTGMQKCSLVPGLPPQLSSLAVRITMRSVIRTALGTASDDSCVHGGLHGYKATGHV